MFSTGADEVNTEFEEKNNKPIQSGKFESIQIDPTSFRKEIKSLNISNTFNKSKQQQLIMMNPQPPQLYSLIILHKEGFPISPVNQYN